MKLHCSMRLLCAAVLVMALVPRMYAQQIIGDMSRWHALVIQFEGPATAESADPNPFTDCRLNLQLSSPTGKSYQVPGFFAADGRAVDTGAKAGTVWRACFTPDEVGTWRYRAQFRTGANVAISLDADAGTPAAFDGATGRFTIRPSTRRPSDARDRGTLRYVGGYYLQYAGSKRYFLKGGADSPENFLAYAEFDDTYDADSDSGSYKKVGTFIHRYAAHQNDWHRGDPVWRDGRGKGIIGALNYLASKGMNSVYFLTYNIDGGDGRDTWMWTGPKVRDRFDCSKLDQWERVFTHMDRLGIMLHVVTQETENDRKLGGSPGLNPIRKLYYRELVARFSHHLAVIWNLGEENNTADADRIAIASYIRALDPYDHPITVHTHANKAATFYNGLLGDPHFEATSIQSTLERYHRDALDLRHRSAAAGRKWVIFGDEQNPAGVGVVPDANDATSHDRPRQLALWGNLMAGGAGVEWYFGSKYPHMDINCEDWRTRARMWDQTRYALEFFQQHLPFTAMRPADGLTAAANDYCFAQPGVVYAVYLPQGGSTALQIESGQYTVQWYDPRHGGALRDGTVKTVTGPGSQSIGQPPATVNKDWVALVRRSSD